MSKCKTVTLRKRKIKNGTQYSLCLDYYPGYRDNTTMKVITREALGIYIFAKPANQQERDFNARMVKKAEILRNRRYEAIYNENNGFFDKARMKGDFLAYYSEQHRRNFDIKDDILRVENDPDDESRLNLTINRKPIADWFREQWHRLRYGARVPQQEERKSRGFKL